QRLRAIEVRDAALDRNPIDLTLAGLHPEIIASVIQILFDSATYDAVIVVVGSSALHDPDLVARPLIKATEKSKKPLLAYVSPEAPHIIRHLNRSGVPAFAAPESCTVALQAMSRTPATPELAQETEDLPQPLPRTRAESDNTSRDARGSPALIAAALTASGPLN